MTSHIITANTLTKEAFAAFGEVIEKTGSHNYKINNGNCIRHHALATTEIAGEKASTIISIFSGQPYAMPLKLTLVERHPLGSQAFMPLHDRPFLVVVCNDENGKPSIPNAFITAPWQGINIKRNVWHGVLTPLGEAGDFLVVDRSGQGNNLEEFHFDVPWNIELP